jgi:hypothetical protein
VLGPVTPGDGRVTVSWTPSASPGSSPVIGYTITARPAAGATVTAIAKPGTTSAVVPGLVNGTAYTVSVTATNAADTGPPSATATVTPAPVRDTLTVTRAQWTPGDLVLEGTGSRPGATVTVHAGGVSGPVVGTAFVAPPPANATAGTWAVRVRTGEFATTRPADVHVVSSGGAALGPVTLTGS